MSRTSIIVLFIGILALLPLNLFAYFILMPAAWLFTFFATEMGDIGDDHQFYYWPWVVLLLNAVWMIVIVFIARHLRKAEGKPQ